MALHVKISALKNQVVGNALKQKGGNAGGVNQNGSMDVALSRMVQQVSVPTMILKIAASLQEHGLPLVSVALLARQTLTQTAA